MASDSKCYKGEIRRETTTDQTLCVEAPAPWSIVGYEFEFLLHFSLPLHWFGF